MKRKYIKLNDNYSHLSIGNIIVAIKEESKNKSSAIQSEVFCALFNLEFINESTVNNYCIGARSIGNDYKQIYINLKKKYEKGKTVFVPIMDSIITIINGRLYNITDIDEINKNSSLKNVCEKLYNISKNDFFVSIEYTALFRNLYKDEDYYSLFIEMLFYAILEKKQPLYEDENIKNVVATILENTDISVLDLQNFLILQLNEGINFSHSIINLAENNNPYANYELAVMEYRGEITGYPRYDKAFNYFNEAAKRNHPSAYWMMGNMILRDLFGSDYKVAVMYFEKAMELGNVAAINSLGLCYKFGKGVKQDNKKALKYFKDAASKNYAYAFNNLGLYYEDIGNFEEAIKNFKKSADLNESFACNKIGEYYRVNNNYVMALFYYQKALKSSFRETTPWAYYNIAKYFYLNGEVTTNTLKDIDTAISYFEKSSQLIESVEELLYIYYYKYLETLNNIDLEKMYHYKEMLENHNDFNEKIKERIENTLINLKRRNTINIPS